MPQGDMVSEEVLAGPGGTQRGTLKSCLLTLQQNPARPRCSCRADTLSRHREATVTFTREQHRRQGPPWYTHPFNLGSCPLGSCLLYMQLTGFFKVVCDSGDRSHSEIMILMLRDVKLSLDDAESDPVPKPLAAWLWPHCCSTTDGCLCVQDPGRLSGSLCPPRI